MRPAIMAAYHLPEHRITGFSAERYEPLGRQASSGGEEDAYEHIMRLVHGFVLYLASEHPRMEPVPPVSRPPIRAKSAAKRRKAEQREARRRHIGYLYVGRGEAPAGTARAGGSTPGVRTQWVRGHFRNQAHGPGMGLRRITWIKPHLRGEGSPEGLAVQRVQSGQPRPLEEDGASG